MFRQPHNAKWMRITGRSNANKMTALVLKKSTHNSTPPKQVATRSFMNIYCERIFLAFVVINGNSFVNIHVIISEMRESNCGVKYVLFALAHTL
jgi:hypothetical protein